MNKLSLVVVLAICVLSFVLEAKAQVDIDKFCAHTEKPENKAYCSKNVAGAKSWEQASTWTLNRLIRLMNRGVDPTLQNINAKLLPNIAPQKKTEIVNKCKSSYSDVVKGLLQCKNLILRDASGAYMTHLSVVSISFNDCREAVLEQNGQPEIVALNNFNAHIKKILDVALSLAYADPRLKQPLPSF